jgi:hypothetical protein
VDPNGEWVHIVVGAVIGGVIGGLNGAYQCTIGGGGECGRRITYGFVGGAAVGALAAGTGGVATGIAGVGFQSAAAGAVVGGAVGGGVGSAGGYASNYLQQKAMGYDPKWDKGDFWKGIGIGAGIGGAMGGLLYGLSDNYALGVDKTVAEWGDRMGMLDRATKAIGYSGDYSVEINGITGEFGKSEYNITKNKVILNADDFSKMGEDGQLIRDASENSVFDSEKFVYATKHETFHYKLTNEYMYRTGTTRDAINSMSKEEFYRTIAHPQEMIAKDINSYRYKDVWRKDINSYINSSLEKEIEGFRKFETIYGY